MNLWIIFSNMQNLTMEFFIGVYVSSIYHDLANAISTVFFLAVFNVSWIRILEGFKKKYGILFRNERVRLVTPEEHANNAM